MAVFRAVKATPWLVLRVLELAASTRLRKSQKHALVYVPCVSILKRMSRCVFIRTH